VEASISPALPARSESQSLIQQTGDQARNDDENGRVRSSADESAQVLLPAAGRLQREYSPVVKSPGCSRR